MTNEVNTAVTSVTPDGKPVAKAPAAKKARKGRPALKLKNGKLYSEAKAEAKADIITAKRAKATAKADVKALERQVNGLVRDGVRQEKSLAKLEATLAKDPKNAELKALVKAAKADLKENAKLVKAKQREVATAQKFVVKSSAAYDKAHAALLKVEEAKLAATAI